MWMFFSQVGRRPRHSILKEKLVSLMVMKISIELYAKSSFSLY